MRRFIAFMLLFALISCPLPAALAAGGEPPVLALTIWNDRLLLARADGLALLSTPDMQEDRVPWPDDSLLLGLVRVAGEVCLLAAVDGSLELRRCTAGGTLLPAPEPLYSYAFSLPGELFGLALLGQELYLCGEDENWECAVWRLPVKGGQAVRVLALDGVQRLCPCGADALLLCGEDERGRYLLSRWDGENRADLLVLPEAVRDAPECLCCPDGDEVAFVTVGNLWRASLAAGDAEPLCTLVDGESFVCAPELWQGRYLALGGAEGLRLVELHPAAEQWVLRVYDALASAELGRAAALFAGRHPEARVLLDHGESLAAEELLARFLDRTAPWDALLLPCQSAALSALLRRGYAQPLGAAAQESAARMYPLVRESVAPEGAALCVPMEISAEASLGLSRAGLERLGLTAEDLPHTWEGLLAWMRDDLPGLLPGGMSAFMTFMPAATWRRALFKAILSDWEEDRRRADPDPGYDDPALRRALEALDALDWEALGNGEAARDSMTVDYSSFLFLSHGDCSPARYNAEADPLLLAFTEDAPAAIALLGGLLIVNPASEHLQEALEFADLACGCLSPASWSCLSPATREGLRDEALAAVLSEAEERVSALEARLAAAAEDERQALADELAAARREAEALSDAAWLVHPQALAWFRAHDARVLLCGEDISLIMNQREMNLLRNEYLRGELPAASFLRALEEKRRMQLLEDAA